MNTSDFFRFVTDLGDSGMTGSFAIMFCLYLLYFNQRRAAFAVGASFALTAAVIAVGKVLLYSKCAVFAVFSSDLRSPSGHAALSCAVYMTIALTIASGKRGLMRTAILGMTALLVLLIGLSRIHVGAHSGADVVAGISIGAALTAALWWYFLRGRAVHCPWGPAFLLCFLWGIVLYGLRVPGEELIRWIAALLRRGGSSC